MKKSLLAFAALAGLTVSASAADLGYKKPSPVPVMAQYNWTGFYAGIQGGYGFSDGVRHTQIAPFAQSGSFKLKGGLVGGTIGYNYQLSNNVVLGAEGDYAWSGIKGSTAIGCVAPGCHTKIDSFGTVRVRAGYAIDRFLPYITGGLALGNVKADAGGANISGSSFRAGWTLGAGLEAAIWNNVTAKVEYLYADLGKFNYAKGTAFVINAPAKAHIVRAGLNYRF